ncbi:hypothetical protein ACFXTN_027767 [Malus domestica]
MLLPVLDLRLIMLNSSLHGLPPEYESFMDVIQFRLGSTTINELYDLLFSQEIQLTNRKKAYSSSNIQAFNSLAISPNSQAFVAQNAPNFNQQQGHGNFSNLRNNQNCGNFSNYQGNNNNQRSNQRYNRGGHSGFNNSTRRLTCQICRRFDHEAYDCPQR